MNFRQLLEFFKEEKVRVLLRERGPDGRIFLGDVVSIGEDRISFKSVNPMKITETLPFGLGEPNKRVIRRWMDDEVFREEKTLSLQISSIASLEVIQFA